MAEPITTNTLDYLVNLGDKMADLLAVEERSGQAGAPTQEVIAAYQRVRLLYSEISARLEEFNQEVARAYRAGNPGPLRDMLSEQGFHHMESNFRDWHDSHIRDLILEKFDFLALRQPEPLVEPPVGKKARALTFETWTFSYEDGTRKQEQSLNQYILQRNEAGWQVDAVDFYTRG